MKKIDDQYDYYFLHQSDEKWNIGLQRVMFGTRVIIYHDNDNCFVNGSFCGGSEPKNVEELWSRLYRWIGLCPDGVAKKCNALHAVESPRPYGKSAEFITSIYELPQANIKVPLTDFSLQPIKYLSDES